jgi:predicted amidohydrolase
VAGDLRANLDEHVRLGRLAAAETARLVVFPALSLTGYEPGLTGSPAFSEDDPRLRPLVESAVSHEATLVAWAPVRLGKSLQIGTLILSPDRTAGVYTKHRLGVFPPSVVCDSYHCTVPPAESDVFQPGDRNPLIRLGTNVAALAVCADVGDPDHAARAVGWGDDSYVAGMFVVPSDFETESERLGCYAVRHGMMTALASIGGPSGGLRSAGRSSVWSKTGDLLARLGPEGSGVAAVDETRHECRTRAVMSPRA